MGAGFGVVKGYTQMGGEGAQWVGLAPFTDTKHFFQNLGDGTRVFGQPGAALRGGGQGTGHLQAALQLHRGHDRRGQDVLGGMSVPDMVKMMEAEGVSRILITTDEPENYPGGKVGGAEVWLRERLMEAEKLLATVPGVTVLIHVQQWRPRSAGCASAASWTTSHARPSSTSVRGPRLRREVQLPQRAAGGKRRSAARRRSTSRRATRTSSCQQGDCPSFATVEGTAIKRTLRAGQRVPLPSALALPEPVSQVPREAFSVCLTGIGGTGVVTVNQILGTAAFRCGMNVQTYDHTGSSQKAGPVISHLKVLPHGAGASPTVGTASADLYLVFDPLVAVSLNNHRRGRTRTYRGHRLHHGRAHRRDGGQQGQAVPGRQWSCASRWTR